MDKYGQRTFGKLLPVAIVVGVLGLAFAVVSACAGLGIDLSAIGTN